MSIDDPTIPDPTLFSKSELRQILRITRRLSLTMQEVISMARERVLSEIDPAPGDGERFQFHRPDFLTADYFQHSTVPAPDANVDLITALYWADRDEQNQKALLDEAATTGRKLSLEAIHQAMMNTWDWQRFLAVRDPDPEGRQRAAAALVEIERLMRRWQLKIDGYIAKHYPEHIAANTAAKAKPQRPYNPRDYFVDEADIPPLPDSSPLLGSAGGPEARAIRDQQIKRTRRATLHEVPKRAPQKLSSMKPKPKEIN
jgi:hypothetical protein